MKWYNLNNINNNIDNINIKVKKVTINIFIEINVYKVFCGCMYSEMSSFNEWHMYVIIYIYNSIIYIMEKVNPLNKYLYITVFALHMLIHKALLIPLIDLIYWTRCNHISAIDQKQHHQWCSGACHSFFYVFAL